jgi:biotin carboxyl carrier protein
LPRRFAVKIDGKVRVVDLEIDNGATSIRVDGVEIGFGLEQAEPGVWVLRRGSEQVLAHVDGSSGKLVVELRRPGFDPAIVGAEVSDARRARIAPPPRAAADGTAPVTIRSPIPGRVVKLAARAGDRVAIGQTVVVVEAMKMENELRAPRAATVAQVHCAEGAAVEGGQDLVTLR